MPTSTDPTACFAYNRGYAWADVFRWLRKATRSRQVGQENPRSGPTGIERKDCCEKSATSERDHLTPAVTVGRRKGGESPYLQVSQVNIVTAGSEDLPNSVQSGVRMEPTLVVAGIAFIGAAIAGGGLVAFKIEVPLIDSLPRQVMLALFGAVLLVMGFVSGMGNGQTPQAEAGGLEATGSGGVTTATTSANAEASGLAETTTSDGPESPGEMRFTTYYWNDGWSEHASWVSPPTLPQLRPVITAFNMGPDYPAFTVRFDDLTISGATNAFDDGTIPPSWQPFMTEGATAEESNGVLVVDLPAGRSTEGSESSVALNPPTYFGGEFDISMSFSVDDDFYALTSAGFGLYVGEGDAVIWVVGGTYSSEQNQGSPSYLIHATTEASQLEGRLRITRTYADG